MEKLFYLLFMLPTLALAQIEVDDQWKTSVNPIFQNLDKNKIQSGMLLDYAMEFIDVTAYNGTLTDSTYINANVVGDIYKTLFMSKVAADTTHTPLFERYAYNWARERYNATKDSSGVYILTGLLYEYQKLNENALAQNKITVSNNKYYDKYISGVWQNPYQTKRAFAVTPPVAHSRSKDVYFKLPNELFLSNLNNQIANIQLDADNGQGYQNMPYNTIVPIQFFENKIHELKFKVTLVNGQTLYCHSKFKIDDPVLERQKQQARGVIIVNDERVYIHEDNNFFSAAWVTIRRIPGNDNITRPLIIAEGLDTGNFTAPEDFGGETTLQNFLGSINNSGDLLPLLDANNNANDYDLIYIDWVRGMGDMQANSRVLEEVIGWVNEQKVGNEPNVLLGQSMGGVIGRYTLARMENEGNTHDVRLFIAHDSPMQGANTPLSIQHFSLHMRELYVESPLGWLTGEVLIPIGYGLAELGSGLLNFFGANTSVPSFVTPSQLLSLQDQAAARQLNYWSAISAPNGNQIQTKSFNESWQQTLDTTGWPALSRNIAISNGNECAVDNGYNPGDALFFIDSESFPSLWLGMLEAIFVGTLVRPNIALIVVGAIPGTSKWKTNFNFNSYGVQGSENRIYRGKISYEKRVLWIGPRITVNITNRSYYAPQDALPLDTFSGGVENFQDFEDELPSSVPSIDFVNPRYGFIPVVSALDIRKSNGNDPTPDDYLKTYSGGVPLDPNLVSGFNAFIVDNVPNQPFNNNHISFQPRNGNWLAEELEASSPGDYPILEDCSAFCTNEAEIVGENILCTSGTYSVTDVATTVIWTVTDPDNLVSFTTNGNEITLNQLNPDNFGMVTLGVFYSNPRCGNITLTQDIEVGILPSRVSNASLTGEISVCDSQQYTYYISGFNHPCVDDVDWTVSDNLNIISHTATSVTVTTNPFNDQYAGIITANLPNSSFTIDKGVWVGVPSNIGLSIEKIGAYDLMVGRWTKLQAIYMPLLYEANGPLNVTFDWQIPNSAIRNYDDTAFKDVMPNNSGQLNIGVRAVCDCGNGEWRYRLFQVSPSGGGNELIPVD